MTAVPARPAPLRLRIGRLALFRAVYLLGLVNTGYPLAIDSAFRTGLWPALFGLFDISAFAWAALPAIWFLLAGPDDRPASATDSAAAAAVVAACLVPIGYCAAVMTSALALWALVTERPRTPLFRASLIALSAFGALFWGKLLLAALGPQMLALDVSLVRAVAGLEGHANIIEFAAYHPDYVGKSLMVAPPCSSLHWVSVALLAWVLVTQVFDLPANRRTIGLGLLGVALTVSVNAARLAAMAYNPGWFDWLHLGEGAIYAGTMSTMLVMAVNFGGNWRAITRSA